MGLQEQAISIPILRMDQKAPEVSGPVGRIRRLVNAVVDKYEATTGDWLRIVKRPAFRVLSKQTADPYAGGLSGLFPGVPAPSILSTLGNQLFAVGSDAIPYVYSESSQALEKYSQETVLTSRTTYAPVYSRTTTTRCPDSATLTSGASCYVWQELGAGTPAAMMMIVGADGEVIRTAQEIGVDGRVKVVSDGQYFWIFFDQATTFVSAHVFDATGDQVAASIVDTLINATDAWDVTYQTDAIGVMLARRGSSTGGASGACLSKLTVSGSTITVTQANASISYSDDGVAILTNKTADGYVYLATVIDSGSVFNLVVSKLDNTGTLAHTFTPIASSLTPIGITNIAGYVDGLGNVHALVSHLPGAGLYDNFQRDSLTELGYATPSADGQGYAALRSAALASRVFECEGVMVAALYYASSLPVPPAIGQPTYFLATADTGAIVGRLMHGYAAADWLWGGPGGAHHGSSWDGTSKPAPNSYQLTSARQSSTSTTLALGAQGQLQFGTLQSGLLSQRIAVTAVGITDATFGAPAIPLPLFGETLIGGPLSRSFDGQQFSAAGIELDPEIPQFTSGGTGTGLFSPGETYWYVIVYSRIDSRGRKVRSGSSVSALFTVTDTTSSANVIIPMLRTTTHDDVIIEVYRTQYIGVAPNGTQGTTHYKVSNDLNPLMNDPTADTVTFNDATSPTQIGDILYGGSGAFTANNSTTGGDYAEVDHDPAPSFPQGCVFQDRAFAIGPDGQVWFSLPQSPGSPYAFNEGLFEMSVPTNEAVVALAPMDGRLIIFCERSIWFVNGGDFYDATGAGNIPTPQQLPITHGCTGVASVIPDGVVYASSAGGFYLLGRDLTSSYIGGPVEDEMVGATVTASATDQKQRAYFLTSTNKILVYDIVFQGWFIWVPPTTALVLAVWKGQLVYADGSDVFVLTPGQFADNPGGTDQNISTTIEFEPMSFADVQMFWDLDLYCSGGTGYSLTPTVFYDLDTSQPDVFPTFNAADMDVDGAGNARYNLPITQPECTYLALTLTDSFPNGPAAGFVLEKMVAAVGLIPGKRRNNLNQRVQA